MTEKTPNFMTPESAAKLKAELDNTLYNLRPKVAMTVAWAASGDNPEENADYLHAKKMLAHYNSRIQLLKARLEDATVIDPGAQGALANGHILFGAAVFCQTVEGDQFAFQILGVDEHDEEEGVISYTCALGRALIGRKEGERVTLVTPDGDLTFDIVKVIYPPLAATAG